MPMSQQKQANNRFRRSFDCKPYHYGLNTFFCPSTRFPDLKYKIIVEAVREVRPHMGPTDALQARCTCPSYHKSGECKHVIAVLWMIDADWSYFFKVFDVKHGDFKALNQAISESIAKHQSRIAA